jgi:ferredoxin
VDTCPSFAIQSLEGRVAVNRYCTHCMRCAENCPKGAIRPTLFHKKESSLLPWVSMAFGGALSLFYAPQGIMALLEWARRLFP